MKSTDTERLHTRIDRKLTRIAKSSAVFPSWYDAWSRLGPGSTGEERLKVCQAIRDVGSVPNEAGYFLVSWAAEGLAENEDARRAAPLQTLNRFEMMRDSDRHFPFLLERQGEARMAALFRTDREEHERRREVGRLFFFGPIKQDVPSDPRWLKGLLRMIADSIVAAGPIETLEFRYLQDGGFWEVHVCPAAAGGWTIEIEQLYEAFDQIDGCGWYAVPGEAVESPYLWIEDVFDAHEAFLRVLPATEMGKGYQTWRRSSK